FSGRQQMHVEAERMRGGRLAFELDPAVGIAREPQTAGFSPTRREPGLGFELLVELHRIAQHLRNRRRRPQLPDEAGRVPRRAARQLAAIDEHDVRSMIAGQVIGGGAADDTAADDHDRGMAGEICAHALPGSWSYFAWARANRSR